MNNKGQSILAEHMVVFFVVVAALTAMTAFVQRGLQARIHDARNFTIDSVNSACDANCLAATGGLISREYEPYYMQTVADVRKNGRDVQGATSGNAAVFGAKYLSSVNEATSTVAGSVQLPAICAGSPNGNCQLTATGS